MRAFSHFATQPLRDELVIGLKTDDGLGTTPALVLQKSTELNINTLEYGNIGATLTNTINHFIYTGNFNRVSWERLYAAWEPFIDHGKSWDDLLLFAKMNGEEIE